MTETVATERKSGTRKSQRNETAWTILGVVRILIGLEFLWAFLDKTFGWTFSTAPEQAWINGGSPTYGYLSAERALQEVFEPLAGLLIVDWLFMLGLLGVGIGLTFGIAVRLSSIAGIAMLLMMWLAAFPIATHPFINYNLVHAVVLAVFPFTVTRLRLSLAGPWSKLTKNVSWLQ